MALCRGGPAPAGVFHSRSQEPVEKLDDTVEVEDGQNSPLSTSPGELEKFRCLLLPEDSTEATAVGQKDPLRVRSFQLKLGACSERI